MFHWIARRHAVEALLVTLSAVVIVAASHDIPYVLHTPYWTDEAWVGLASRVPLREALDLSGSSPPLWTLMTLPFHGFGEQAARLLTMGFTVATGIVAYYLGRPHGRVAAAALGAGALLMPAVLERNDLKQYAADALMVAVTLLLTQRGVDQGWSRRLLWTFTSIGLAGFLVSTAMVFAYATAVIIMILSRPRWRTLIAPGAVLAAGMAAEYLVFYQPKRTENLHEFWTAFYPTPGGLWGYASDRLDQVSRIAPGGSWKLLLALIVIGIVVHLRRRDALLWAYGLILIAVGAAAGTAQIYPYLDVRTSHYLWVGLTLTVMLGIVRLRVGRLRPVLAAALLIVMAVISVPHWRSHSIPTEDARTSISEVLPRMGPHDVLVTNAQGFSASYYLTDHDFEVLTGTAGLPWMKDHSAATDFSIVSTGRFIVAREGMDDMAAALQRAHAEGGVMWVVLSHIQHHDYLAQLMRLPHVQILRSLPQDAVALVR